MRCPDTLTHARALASIVLFVLSLLSPGALYVTLCVCVCVCLVCVCLQVACGLACKRQNKTKLRSRWEQV